MERKLPLNKREGYVGKPVIYWLGPNQPTERTEVKYVDLDGKEHTAVFDPKAASPNAQDE